jgi:hypothetical protein
MDYCRTAGVFQPHRSLVPPFRPNLANWRSIPLPRGTHYSEPAKYEARIRFWLKSWDPFGEGVSLASYKQGKALTWQGNVQGSKVQEFRRQTIDEAIRLELLDWAKRTTRARTGGNPSSDRVPRPRLSLQAVSPAGAGHRRSAAPPWPLRADRRRGGNRAASHRFGNVEGICRRDLACYGTRRVERRSSAP